MAKAKSLPPTDNKLTVRPRSVDDVALTLSGISVRYDGISRQSVTQRWPKERGFPKPDFYVGRSPYWYLSTLQAWEARCPKDAPDHPIMHQAGPAEAT